MRVLFCNIAWMDYYQGIVPGKDEPRNGGSYVKQNNDAHEKYNFQSVHLSMESGGYEEDDYCLGFVETKSTTGKTVNQLKIEKIEGCGLLKNEPSAEDVLVVYCAKFPDSLTNETYVVGWYNHATVYRYYEELVFANEDGSEYIQAYNAIARKKDCVLLPRGARRKSNTWKVPRKQSGAAYGFGQANVWFASGADENQYLKNFLDRIIGQIQKYDGENWVDVLKE